MYHTAPNVYALSSAVRGLDMTIMTGFDPEEFLRLVEAHRVSVVQMVPTMFVRLLALPEPRSVSATTCRRCGWSSTPPPRARRTSSGR